MKKMRIVFLIMVVSLVGFMGVLKMKKNIPYDFEVIPNNHVLQVVNTTTWANKDCIITVKGSMGSQEFILPYKTKVVKINGLTNGELYTITIRRNDLFGRLRYRSSQFFAVPHKIEKYIVLLGASVGKSWNLRELMNRKRVTKYFWGYRGYYEFDKKPLVDTVIASPLQPDVVIIKECAAYFPRDIRQGIAQVEEWIGKLEEAKIEPVLATVVPITENRAAKNPMQLQSLNEFNNAIRQLCTRKGLKLLDLQKALSNNSEKGALNDRYADSDGLHLKQSAYRDNLDNLMVNFFEK